MVIAFTGPGNAVKAGNIKAGYSSAFSPVGNHHHSSINDPDKRLNADRYKVRTKANLENWEISLPAEWHYQATVFFSYHKRYYYQHNSSVSSTYLLSTSLRGPPAIAIFPALA